MREHFLLITCLGHVEAYGRPIALSRNEEVAADIRGLKR